MILPITFGLLTYFDLITLGKQIRQLIGQISCLNLRSESKVEANICVYNLTQTNKSKLTQSGRREI